MAADAQRWLVGIVTGNLVGLSGDGKSTDYRGAEKNPPCERNNLFLILD